MSTPVWRFAIIKVGCLECAFDSECEPEMVATVDSWEEAMQALRDTGLAHDGQHDAFIFDTLTGSTLGALELYRLDKADRESSQDSGSTA